MVWPRQRCWVPLGPGVSANSLQDGQDPTFQRAFPWGLSGGSWGMLGDEVCLVQPDLRGAKPPLGDKHQGTGSFRFTE